MKVRFVLFLLLTSASNSSFSLKTPDALEASPAKGLPSTIHEKAVGIHEKAVGTNSSKNNKEAQEFVDFYYGDSEDEFEYGSDYCSESEDNSNKIIKVAPDENLPIDAKNNQFIIFNREIDQENLKKFRLTETSQSNFSGKQVIEIWDSFKRAFVSGDFGNYEELRIDLDHTDYVNEKIGGQLKTLDDLHQKVNSYLNMAFGFSSSENYRYPFSKGEELQKLQNLLSLVFENLPKKDPNEQAATIIQLVPGLTHCETGQIAVLQYLSLGLEASEDGTDFKNQLEQVLARIKEEAANQAFLPTDQEVQALDTFMLKADEGVQVQQSWRWKLKNVLGLKQTHETPHGMMGQDIFGNSSSRALERFFAVFTPERIINNIKNWVNKNPTRLEKCASYLVEKGLVHDDLSNLIDFFETKDGVIPTALTPEGSKKLLIDFGLLKTETPQTISR